MKAFGLIWSAVCCALWINIALGWAMNLCHVIAHHTPFDADTALRLAGVFVPPLGGFLGWFW